jgi:hypothetical protein
MNLGFLPRPWAWAYCRAMMGVLAFIVTMPGIIFITKKIARKISARVKGGTQKRGLFPTCLLRLPDNHPLARIFGCRGPNKATLIRGVVKGPVGKKGSLILTFSFLGFGFS